MVRLVSCQRAYAPHRWFSALLFVSMMVGWTACEPAPDADTFSSSSGSATGSDDGTDQTDGQAEPDQVGCGASSCSCPSAGPCVLQCTGFCTASCGPSKQCGVDCPGGGCRVDCGGADTCEVGCAGGGCTVTCGNASQCAIACPGGNCPCLGSSCP